MCRHCDYRNMLKAANLGFTQNRLRVLSVIGGASSPLSAGEIHARLGGESSINKVTVYRILDLLVQAGLVDKLSGGGRRFFFGLAPNEHHDPHPHFYCKTCGAMQCLAPGTVRLDAGVLADGFVGRVEKVEIRLDGTCRACLNSGLGQASHGG